VLRNHVTGHAWAEKRKKKKKKEIRAVHTALAAPNRMGHRHLTPLQATQLTCMFEDTTRAPI
jgi:hypothetical protein